MVCLENSDNAQPKKSKKKKEKLNLSSNTDKSNDIFGKIENKCENGTSTQQESRKAKKKKQKTEIIESLDSLQTETSEIETIVSLENREHCEDGSENVKRKGKKKKKKLELPSNPNNAEINAPADKVITREKDEKKSLGGLEEPEKLQKSKKKKQKRDLKESSKCIDDSPTTATDDKSGQNVVNKNIKETKQSRKSKKKKQKIKTQPNDIERGNENEPVTQESSELAAVGCSDQAVFVPQELCVDSNKKKKSKRRQKEKCLDNANVEVSTSVAPVEPKKSKKRKKMDSNDADVNDEAQELADSCDMLPNKKRKKHTSKAENVQSEENLASNDKPSKVKNKKSKKVEMSTEENENLPEDIKAEIFKEADEETPINACENKATVTKKRKKKSKNKDSSSQLPDSNSCEQRIKQKKKKSISASPLLSNGDVSSINKECSGTVITNNDESELQHNTTPKPEKHNKSKHVKDIQNGDTNITNETADDNLGQWKTAELSSSAQEKFARLLGARKKRYKPVVTPLSDLKAGESVLSKLTGVWKPPPERTLFGSLLNREKKFAKMAMDQKETAKLNESLETQYNKTLEFNLQKRKEGNTAKGLGFQEDPAKGKKHYIDIHKVKSIELD